MGIATKNIIQAGITANIENSKINVKIDCEDIFSVFGIYADEYVLFENGSEADFDLRTSGQVYGIAPEGDFSSDNSKVSVKVGNHDKFGAFGCYGIMCGSFVMKADEADQRVTSHADGGMALGVNLNDTKEEAAEYQEGYEAKNFIMRDESSCLTPEDSVISLGSVEEGDDSYKYYLWVETVYSKSDTTKPAEKIVFGIL